MRSARVGKRVWASAVAGTLIMAGAAAVQAVGPGPSQPKVATDGAPVIANIAVSDQLPPVANSITDFGALRFLSATSRDGLPGNPTTPPPTTPLVSLTVQPNPVLLSFNTLSGSGQQQLRVTGTYQDGSTRDLSSTGMGTSYSASGALVGVTAGGIVFANAGAVPASGRGRVTLTVQNGGRAAAVDVTVDAFSPRPLRTLPLPGTSLSVLVRGQYAYVSDGPSGLTIVDVSNRAAPFVVSTTNVGAPVHQAALVGSFAYLAAESKVVMLDVSQPGAPQVAFNLPMTNATGVQVVGNHLYVADGAAGLRVVALTPFPSQVVATRTAAAPVTAISGSPPRMLALAGNQTLLFDATLASSPSLVGAIAGQNPRVATTGLPSAARVSGIYGYVANGFNGIFGLDLRAAPAVVGGSNLTPNVFNATGGLALAGNFLFATDSGGTRNAAYIFSLLDPANPTYADKVDFASLAAGGTPQFGIDADRQYVYVTRQQQLEIGQFLRFADTGSIPPSVSILTPADGAIAKRGGSQAVTVDATDDVAVESVSIFVDGALASTQTDFPLQPFVVTLPSSGSSAVLTASARDFNGNVGTSAPRTLTLSDDVTPPSASLSLARAERTQFKPGEAIAFNASAVDETSVARFELYAGGVLVDTRVFAPPGTPKTAALSGSATALGPVTFQLKAYDAGGNAGTASQVVTIAADPTLTLAGGGTINAGDTYFDNTSISVTGGTLTVSGAHTFTTVTLSGSSVLAAPTLSPLLINAENLSVGPSARIDMTGRGYGCGEGPGSHACGSSYVGSSHGGVGWPGDRPTYGNEYDPNTPGGASGWGPPRGGGVIRVNVSGTLSLAGQIVSHGGGTDGSGATAAGGSIRIDAGTLSGAGTIAADGQTYTGSGGGRIAVYYGNRAAFTGSVHAYGGGGARPAGAGTVYWKAASEQYGELRCDNAGVDSWPNDSSTPMRFVGTGVLASVSPSRLTVASAAFPVPSADGVSPGLRGLRIRPNTANAATFRILDNDATSLTLDPADGDATLVASAGSTYEGVRVLDRLSVFGWARAFSSDPIELPYVTSLQAVGILNVPNLRAPLATTLTDSTLHMVGPITAPLATLLRSNLETWTAPIANGGVAMTLNASTYLPHNAFTPASLSLVAGSVLSHSTGGGNRLDLTTANLTIDSSSKIDVSGRGYGCGEGPGSHACGSSYVGSSHGGLGWPGDRPTYGNEYDPNTPGGASGWGPPRGGGVARIKVTGALSLAGQIVAHGGGSDGSGATAAGGSIRIDAGSISGGGTIAADGQTYSGSGGGRIAVYYTSSTFTGPIHAYGAAGARPSGAGSVFIKRADQPYGELTYDNAGQDSGALGWSTTARSVGSGTLASVSPSRLTVASAAFPVPSADGVSPGLRGLRIRPNTANTATFRILDNDATSLTLDPADGDATLVASPGSTYEGVRLLDVFHLYGNSRLQSTDAIELTSATTQLAMWGALSTSALRAPSATTLVNSGLVIYGPIVAPLTSVVGSYLETPTVALSSVASPSFSGSTFVPWQPVAFPSISLLGGSVMTHPTGGGYSLSLTTGSLTIDGSSRIDVSGRGYGCGEGPGSHACGSTYVGSSHGGLGWPGDRPTYGSELDPATPGGASGYGPLRGGGVARISVSGTLSLAGQILANGGGSDGSGATAAGGSIRLDVGALTGGGQIYANGQTYTGSGGGRIAIYYGSYSFTGPVFAYGIGPGSRPGGAGTVYYKATSQQWGDLVVDNGYAPVLENSTPIRSVGAGTIASVLADRFTATTSAFPVPGFPNAGLIGLHTRVDGSPTILAIVTNSVNQVVTSPEGGDLTTLVAPGGSYTGVRMFDALYVRANARLQSNDRIEVTTFSANPGARVSSPNLVYP